MKTIYTENKNLTEIRRWTENFFDSFNIQEAIGIWENKKELSLIISGEEKPGTTAQQLAAIINKRNDQQCCLITGAGDYKILYRIYAETGSRTIERIISRYFKGYTIIKESGQVVYEIIADNYKPAFARALINKTDQVAISSIIRSCLVYDKEPGSDKERRNAEQAIACQDYIRENNIKV